MKTINFKRPSIIFAVFFAIPLFFSCKGSDEDIITYYDTYIDGYITDYHTGEPVEGVIFDAKYFDDSNVGLLGTSPYYATKIAVSDANGYYKIKTPKTGEFWSQDRFVDFTGIRIIPRATENYSFEFGTFNYKSDSLKVKSKRIDIRPITYGYLKVTLPKTSVQNWSFLNYTNSDYEKPYYKPKLVISDSYNDSLNYFLFKVPVSEGTFRIGNNAWSNPIHFTIENPRDTVILNVEQ